jgi:phosphoenolpyruvate carboxykinase (ATP)
MVRAALGGAIAPDGGRRDPNFGFLVPERVPDVPPARLDPRGTWPDPAAYDRQAAQLAAMFRDNFKRYESGVAREILAAAPSA